ncbi:interferon alpha-3-like protein [Labeo rohita]|uniref:Interferon alpha-3-like protein n=1 Tax=Labeo rohita TaxID=84645 RepID=A0A498P0A6_LABRO|nr:interferon alpha-3-like protein [Labeo rohita]
METEVNKEDPVIDLLRELSALLSEKEEMLLELDVRIEERTDTDDLENEIVDVEEYKQRVITTKSRMIPDNFTLQYSRQRRTSNEWKKVISEVMEFLQKEILSRERTMQLIKSGKSIVWQLIVERAAWWGGFWERLVSSFPKDLLYLLDCLLLFGCEAIANCQDEKKDMRTRE